MSETNDALMQVLGRVPSGIFILTAGKGDQATGMLASWVMQAGFKPPMVTVAVNKDRYVGEWLGQGDPFVLNVVSESQKGLLAHFGQGFAPEEPAFEGLEITEGDNGVTRLIDSLGHLECEPVSHLDSGDHRIFLAKITAGKLHTEEDPMVHIRKSGAHY